MGTLAVITSEFTSQAQSFSLVSLVTYSIIIKER